MLKEDIELVQQPIPNMAELDGILDYIDAHPEEWRQQSWVRNNYDEQGEVCGTAFCIAGHAVHRAGYEKFDYAHQGVIVPLDHKHIDKTMTRVLREMGHIPDDVALADFHSLGRDILGLTYAEALDLFAGGNTRHQVGVKVEAIRYRAKQQAAAFERIAEELISSVPELAEVLKPGYLCPESQETILALINKRGDGN